MYGKTLSDSIQKLYSHEDIIVKRFCFKLLVRLIAASRDCKKSVNKDAALVEEMKKIFTTSSDDVLVEYSSVLLRSLCDDPKLIDSLGRDEIFLESLFAKFKSHDPDILKNSMQLLSDLMKNSFLIETVLAQKDFLLKNLEVELKNENREIQMAALESLQWITCFVANPFWEAIGSQHFVEAVYSISMVSAASRFFQTCVSISFAGLRRRTFDNFPEGLQKHLQKSANSFETLTVGLLTQTCGKIQAESQSKPRTASRHFNGVCED